LANATRLGAANFGILMLYETKGASASVRCTTPRRNSPNCADANRRSDVWGDTVNTASRVESHSLPGHIQLFRRDQGRPRRPFFELEQRGIVEIKGKGMMETYFLSDR